VTIGQLVGISYELDSHGRLKIESKESARARGVPSPDRADALMLALCRLPWKIEILTTRDFNYSRSNSPRPISREHPYWGFTLLGDDDGLTSAIHGRDG
jgi:hypothetical protein